MQMNLRFWIRDRYDFHGDKPTPIPTVSDDDIGRLHKVGLAREYNVRGQFFENHEWEGGPDKSLQEEIKEREQELRLLIAELRTVYAEFVALDPLAPGYQEEKKRIWAKYIELKQSKSALEESLRAFKSRWKC